MDYREEEEPKKKGLTREEFKKDVKESAKAGAALSRGKGRGRGSSRGRGRGRGVKRGRSLKNPYKDWTKKQLKEKVVAKRAKALAKYGIPEKLPRSKAELEKLCLALQRKLN